MEILKLVLTVTNAGRGLAIAKMAPYPRASMERETDALPLPSMVMVSGVP